MDQEKEMTAMEEPCLVEQEESSEIDTVAEIPRKKKSRLRLFIEEKGKGKAACPGD